MSEKAKMVGDWTGHIIAIAGISLNVLTLVIGGLYALAKVDSRLQSLTIAHDSFVDRLNRVDAKLEGFGATLIQLAKQEERLNSQDARHQELVARVESIFAAIRTPRRSKT